MTIAYPTEAVEQRNASSSSEVYLVFGPRGWIGGQMIDMLRSQGKQVFAAQCRLEEREKIIAEVERSRATHVLNCAGVTGRPSVDYCEDHRQEVIRANVIGALTLADVCWQRNITNFATGCIYHYDDAHTIGGKPFTEEDKPNFDGSYYSKTKAMVETMLREYTNVLTLRLRMPISDDLHSRSFVTKITKYEYVVDIPNSMTLLHDLLPASIVMAQHRLVGVYNFTNPGAISHNEVLSLFKKHVRPDFAWKNFDLDAQAKILKAGRSNCELDSSKLTNTLAKFGISIPEVHQAYEDCFKRMAVNLTKE